MLQRVVLCLGDDALCALTVAWPAHGIRSGHGLHGTQAKGSVGSMLQRSINMLQRWQRWSGTAALTHRSPCRYRLGQRSQRSIVVGDIRIGLQARPRPHAMWKPRRVGYHAAWDPTLGRVRFHVRRIALRCAVESLRR